MGPSASREPGHGAAPAASRRHRSRCSRPTSSLAPSERSRNRILGPGRRSRRGLPAWMVREVARPMPLLRTAHSRRPQSSAAGPETGSLQLHHSPAIRRRRPGEQSRYRPDGVVPAAQPTGAGRQGQGTGALSYLSSISSTHFLNKQSWGTGALPYLSSISSTHFLDRQTRSE